jgi:hypothetical protein
MSAPAADGRGGAAPPRPAAPAGDRRPPWFTFGPWLSGVRAAARLLRRAPRPAQPLPVTLWARACGLIPDPAASPRPIPLPGPGSGFGRGYALATDVAKPVIVATVPVPAGPPAALLTGGCHRLYKAAVTGWEHLPSLWLTAAETLAVRHPATLGPGRRWAAGTANQP